MLGRELLRSARQLLRTPAFTLGAVVSLALGIGANAAIFSLLDALLFKQLPVREPDRLVRIGSLENNGQTFALPGPLLEDLRREPLLDGVCGFQTPLSTVELNGRPEALGALSLSGDCYRTLGVRPAIGRLFSLRDDTPYGVRVAVLDYNFWQTRFGGSASVLGRSIRIGSPLFTVIGVTEPRFGGLLLGFPPAVSFLLSQESAFAASISGEQPFYWADVIARLKPGVTPQQVQAQLGTKWRRLLDSSLPRNRFQGEQREELLSMPPKVTPGGAGVDYSMRNRYRHPLTALLAVSVLVLLVSCINVASLLLARGLKLQREIAIRGALGATRRRIVRDQLFESALLLLAGFLAAGALAYSCDHLLLSVMATYSRGFSLDAAPDKYVLLFTAAAGMLALSLFGILPAWQTSNIDSTIALKTGSRALSGSPARSRRILISGQVALTLVLVTGAALFVQGLRHLETEPLGFQTDAIVNAQLLPLAHAFPAKFDVGSYYRDFLDRIKALPGVESVSISSFSPLVTAPYKEDIRIAGSQHAVLQAPGEFVSDAFFATMHIPLLEGRDFSRGDRPESQRTAILSRALAQRLFPDETALGRHIQFGTEPETRDLEVIGIAADARLEDIHDGDLSFIYFNLWQRPQSGNWGNLQVRYSGSTREIVSALHIALRKMGRQYALYVHPLNQQRDYSLLREKLLALIGSFFAALALALAAVGLFGLLSFLVARRTAEIGVRMALGAERRTVSWLIVREGLVLVGVGIAVGLPVCYVALREIPRLLYAGTSGSMFPLLVAVAALCAVTAIATLTPAYRASSIDPMAALRQE